MLMSKNVNNDVSKDSPIDHMHFLFPLKSDLVLTLLTSTGYKADGFLIKNVLVLECIFFSRQGGEQGTFLIARSLDLKMNSGTRVLNCRQGLRAKIVFQPLKFLTAAFGGTTNA